MAWIVEVHFRPLERPEETGGKKNVLEITMEVFCDCHLFWSAVGYVAWNWRSPTSCWNSVNTHSTSHFWSGVALKRKEVQGLQPFTCPSISTLPALHLGSGYQVCEKQVWDVLLLLLHTFQRGPQFTVILVPNLPQIGHPFTIDKSKPSVYSCRSASTILKLWALFKGAHL